MGSCSKDFPLRSSIKAAFFGKRSNLVIQARSYLPSKNLSTPIDIQSILPYPNPFKSNCQRMSSYSRQSSTSSNVSNAGTSSFQVGRERQRQPEMELFSHGRKPRSNYRRPSSLGLANTPLPDKSEAKHEFTPLTSGRSHIVAPPKDHLKPEGSFEMTSEGQSQYRNLSPSRPVIHKLKDHLKPQGDFDHNSETNKSYKDNHASRPVIHKLKDHSVDVQPEGSIAKNSEYNTNFAKSMKGERAPPAWLSDFEKVTIE